MEQAQNELEHLKKVIKSCLESNKEPNEEVLIQEEAKDDYSKQGSDNSEEEDNIQNQNDENFKNENENLNLF